VENLQFLNWLFLRPLYEFDTAVVPLRERFAANQKQAQTLATLRDTLLPRLISGQLRLPELAAAETLSP
jgi:type I restriction enzyme, S subunit